MMEARHLRPLVVFKRSAHHLILLDRLQNVLRTPKELVEAGLYVIPEVHIEGFRHVVVSCSGGLASTKEAFALQVALMVMVDVLNRLLPNHPNLLRGEHIWVHHAS